MPDAGRVITGVAGGLRLDAPGEGTRPLGDKVKQALFSMLESARGLTWQGTALDLYAGSGAAGIEALSRGASSAVFVEKDARAVRVIAGNLRHTRLSDRARIVRRDVLAFLAADTAGVPEAPFGVVVLDPPYSQVDELLAAMQRLGDDAGSWLEPDAVVVAKHFWRDAPPAEVGCLVRLRDRRFGETALSVYRRSPDTAAGGCT